MACSLCKNHDRCLGCWGCVPAPPGCCKCAKPRTVGQLIEDPEPGRWSKIQRDNRQEYERRRGVETIDSPRLSSVRETSVEAYRDLKDSGKLTALQHCTYVLLLEHGPCTAQELQGKSSQQGVWKRLSEVARKGYATEAGKTRCRVTGKVVIAWKAVR